MPDYAARVRAARKYAGLTQQELADALGVDVQTIKRRELPPDHEGHQPPKKGERRAIADICGVPFAFMEDGFRGESRSEISQRLAGLENEAEQLRAELGQRALAVIAQLGALQDQVTRFQSRQPPAAPGEQPPSDAP